MTSYVTPKKNAAFVFYVSLEDKANAGLFKASPTLAAGDVLVATDDGAPANITTLPAVDADFTKRLKVSLSAAEMNGDNVTVIFSDAAGAEWYDLEVNIQTSARQVDDLATPDSILLRDWEEVTETVPDRSTLNALRFLRNKWAAASGTLKVYEEDDTTVAWEAALTTASDGVITGSDPA